METIILSDAEYQILSLLIQHKTFKKANQDLYEAFEVTVLWKYIYGLRDKRYIDLILEPRTNKVKEIKINKDIAKNLEHIEIKENNEVKNGTQVAEYSRDMIRFHMQKMNSDSIFSSQFGGIISFPNQVVLEANKNYIYAAFNRENGNLLLTLTPEEKIIQSALHSNFESKPAHIQDIIKGFLNDLKSNM